eukprot:46712-Eustigmatos_ZCMA.PRE.1
MASSPAASGSYSSRSSCCCNHRPRFPCLCRLALTATCLRASTIILLPFITISTTTSTTAAISPSRATPAALLAPLAPGLLSRLPQQPLSHRHERGR